MDPFQNPFSPGAGTQPPAFIGRDALIEDYEIALRRTIGGRPGKSIMPIGLRGVGKTVLLNRFHAMAQERQLAGALIEASDSGDFKHLLTARLRSGSVPGRDREHDVPPRQGQVLVQLDRPTGERLDRDFGEREEVALGGVQDVGDAAAVAVAGERDRALDPVALGLDPDALLAVAHHVRLVFLGCRLGRAHEVIIA